MALICTSRVESTTSQECAPLSCSRDVSLAALAALPILPAYSVSKAAAFNMTQSLRAFLADQGGTVHAVILGPIDMNCKVAARWLGHAVAMH